VLIPIIRISRKYHCVPLGLYIIICDFRKYPFRTRSERKSFRTRFQNMAKSSETAERTVQQDFINKLKSSLPAGMSLVDELADILNVSTDSAYRRIRGETALTIDEVSKLCAHYKIPFDQFTQSDSGKAMVTFQYSHLSADMTRFNEYLDSLIGHMDSIRKAEPKEIIWCAEDVPIFHHFKYPKLSAFKVFYWTKSILNAPELEDKHFDPNIVPEVTREKVRRIYDLYNRIPSIEIWTEDTLNSTLKQVEYYIESGLFGSVSDAIDVVNDVEAMIRSLEKQVAKSVKFSGDVPTADDNVEFKLYFSDLMVGNNCILITAGASKVCYISINTFNSMATTNPGFNEETDRWIRNIIAKSTLISGVSEKQRMKFFKLLYDKIAATRAKIANA
jgi:hypothetical protein